MAKLTFQVVDGVDKGRVFRELSTPVTIGREEGNLIRLNDERISRFHIKIQQDQGDVVLTDLDSTNGTRVNGHAVQIHRLRPGDCINIGRSMLLFGSSEEIAARLASLTGPRRSSPLATVKSQSGNKPAPNPTLMAGTQSDNSSTNEADLAFDLDDQIRITDAGLFIGHREFPPLPKQLSPSQSARLAEILDFLHRALAQATSHAKADESGTQMHLDFQTWQRILAVELLLARYLRAVTEPDSWKR